ncbi:hypothetical protein P872_07390 [Rhodonellum psychrophilum GCM71 = DSM 17998]|uniref:Uncharacterized protein n=1 Tax=Rhodonellum psychrophilum GCM71 = DSM 17998 TaxID=1123057 RepID=U5BWG7_9BACT|nr:hypothetical protein P872_07390 [Rhodonellum psychrophilum GCM71 = DSM 17998]
MGVKDSWMNDGGKYNFYWGKALVFLNGFI